MTPEEINNAIQKAVTEALKPITTQVGQLVEQVKPIGEIQNQVKGLIEADSARTIADKDKPAEKGGKKGDDASAAAAGLTTEQATELFKTMLAERDTAAATTAQQQAAHEAWVKKNAPKLAGTPLGKRIFAGTKTDEERQAALTEYVDGLKSAGVKAPDLGATAEGEGGEKSAADARAAQEAASLDAAGKVKTTSL